MLLKELLDSLTTKHIKQIVRAHNLHTRIYLGSSREVMIDGLLSHYNLKNTNELLSKLHTLTIPTEDAVIPKRVKPAIVRVRQTVNITRKTRNQPEQEPEPAPEPAPEPVIKQPRDVSGLVSAIKNTRANKQLIDEAKEELKQLREKKQKEKDHEIFKIRIRGQRAEIQRKKDEEAEKTRKSLIKEPRDVSGLVSAIKNTRAKKQLIDKAKTELQQRRTNKAIEEKLTADDAVNIIKDYNTKKHEHFYNRNKPEPAPLKFSKKIFDLLVEARNKKRKELENSKREEDEFLKEKVSDKFRNKSHTKEQEDKYIKKLLSGKVGNFEKDGIEAIQLKEYTMKVKHDELALKQLQSYVDQYEQLIEYRRRGYAKYD